MNDLGIGLTIFGVISGSAGLMVIFDYSTWVHPSYHRKQALLAGILMLVGSIAVSIGLVMFFHKGCDSYTTEDYKDGFVPISCGKD